MAEHKRLKTRIKRFPFCFIPVPFVLMIVLSGCGGVSEADAVELVKAYNTRVIEAYQTADFLLVEPVAGPSEVRKIAGLIGVKSDMNRTLDSEITEFVVTDVKKTDLEILVFTQEKWHYSDREIGTGEVIGKSSDDQYEMRYRLQQFDGIWKVAEIEFTSTPHVGRDPADIMELREIPHGMKQPESGSSEVK